MDAAEQRRRFEAIVLPHLDAAYNLARWLCGGGTEAEDVLQEAMLRAYRYFDAFHGEQARPWLLAIVRNTCASTWERRDPAQAGDGYDENRDGGEALPGWQEPALAGPEQWLLRAEDVRLVREALARLPVPFREVIVLRELEDLPYRDIARIADVPIGTVMSRLARARRLLADTVTALRTGTRPATRPAEAVREIDAGLAGKETGHGMP
ncbi:RNA polymerase subunit sigma [Cupriavidus sp. USMAA2-4]|uniref:RNA polymerase sigma factor n=1 Tax=Cupriavidus sp. USMAA2-4 TaxID=876364 RepID=UPI0008A66E57|nr:RNA polymerase sigma factor [Cupriavidus sp. USMAA2-4]AOY91495.1 RNA polymerase subunit sigma [Cupriavidus sp. USMAA2-4]